MKSTWKKIGNFVSLLDLKKEIIYLRKYQYWRREAVKTGLTWGVPEIMLYFKNSDGAVVEKMWNYSWKLLHEEYKIAKFAFVEFGMKGWTSVSANSHTYKAGDISRIGEWTLKLWNVEDGEIDLLSQNEYVQDKITRYYIRILHEGKIPWKQSWKGQETPQNLETAQTYRGINLLTTLYSGGTYFLRKKQILDLGGTIRFDAVKYPMVWWKWYTFVMVDGVVTTVSYIGNMWMDEWGKTYPKNKIHRGWFLRHFYVYDVEQMVTGLEHMIPTKVDDVLTPIEKCEDLIRNLPETLYKNYESERFTDMFRDLSLKASSILKYPENNLITEFSIMFLCAETGIDPPKVESPTELIESALKLLKSDRNQIIKAAQLASKIVDYILNRPSYESPDD